jgi:hypothetical protein
MPESLTNWIGSIADIIGVGGALFAGLAWWVSRGTRKMLEAEKQRMNEPVGIVLQVEGGRRIELPSPIRRSELSRAELLGRIGMLPRKDPKAFFAIGYLSSDKFFKQLSEVQDASGASEMVISCTEQEWGQFKWNGDHAGAPSTGTGEPKP